MDFSYKNIRGINDHVLKLGMLSPPDDIIASWLVFKNMGKISSMLELGSYLGGGIGIFNQLLQELGHNVEFTGVDHLDFIGAGARNSPGAWYTNHFNQCLTADERTALQNCDTPDQAANWIIDRTKRLTGLSLHLECVRNETELGEKQYDIIHHDYGDSVEENLTTIETCLPKLKDTGVYVVDDWCTGAPLRTVATIIAQQKGLLYPIMWGKNKVFFAKNPIRAQQLVFSIIRDTDNDPKLFKFMPGSQYFGTNYKSVRMHWQAIQWS